jgi:uncharacterized protein YycO
MPQQPFKPVVEREDADRPHVTRFAPGEEARPDELEPGDFILTHGSSFFSYLIRFGQRLRFRGKDAKYARWSHAAIITSSKGDLIEAVGAGVSRANLSKYRETEYHLVKLAKLADARDREQAVRYATWSLGESYAFFNIVSIALSLLMGGKFTFGFDGQAICSGLVARALERTNAIFNRSPSHIMPADLAKYFKVTPPPPGTSKGRIP